MNNEKRFTAYFDGAAGVSGDMLLGALVSAGAQLEPLQRCAASLGLEAELASRVVMRQGISATKIDVTIAGHMEMPGGGHEPEHGHEHGHEHSHEHEALHAHEHEHGGAAHSHGHGDEGEGHSHSHEHLHTHEAMQAHVHAPETHSHSHAPGEGHVHRGLREIRSLIAAAEASAAAKSLAIKAFELLGAAEGKIHGKDPEAIHFHEVGSGDAIVDILCGAVAAESLGVRRWLSSPLNVGGGTVRCAHGVLPVPAPATLELLRGCPVYSSGVERELVTPTGAAMLRALGVEFAPFPAMRLAATGYGAGEMDLPGMANVLRVSLGEAEARPEEILSGGDAIADEVTVIEAAIDDMSPQLFGYLSEKLLAAGALDVFGAPVQMKKNRPGIELNILTRPADARRMMEMVFRESTTIGLRLRQQSRYTLPREFVTVATQWGEVRLKLARLGGSVVNLTPEYEDCRRIAEAQKLPLKDVMRMVVRQYEGR
jgi:hypothetical protein